MFNTAVKVLKKKDTTARVIIIKGLNEADLQLVNTCTNAVEIWKKLFAVYEQSSGQRLDRLLSLFFNYSRILMTTLLQSIFLELNDEMQRLENVKLPEVLISRVMATLSSEYFEFQSVWKSVPRELRTVNLLTERLRLIKARPLKKHEQGTTAFVTKAKHKQSDSKKDIQML